MALTTPARVARTVWLEAGTCHRPSCGREGRQRGRNKYENAGKSQSVLVVISSRSRTAHTRVTTDSPHASSQSMLCVCVCARARACVCKGHKGQLSTHFAVFIHHRRVPTLCYHHFTEFGQCGSLQSTGVIRVSNAFSATGCQQLLE
jgi:hypothetical protein